MNIYYAVACMCGVQTVCEQEDIFCAELGGRERLFISTSVERTSQWTPKNATLGLLFLRTTGSWRCLWILNLVSTGGCAERRKPTNANKIKLVPRRTNICTGVTTINRQIGGTRQDRVFILLFSPFKLF